MDSLCTESDFEDDIEEIEELPVEQSVSLIQEEIEKIVGTIQKQPSPPIYVCHCKTPIRDSKDDKPVTQEYIDNKLHELSEVEKKIHFLECTCESGNRIANEALEHLQEIIDKINALSTDY